MPDDSRQPAGAPMLAWLAELDDAAAAIRQTSLQLMHGVELFETATQGLTRTHANAPAAPASVAYFVDRVRSHGRTAAERFRDYDSAVLRFLRLVITDPRSPLNTIRAR